MDLAIIFEVLRHGKSRVPLLSPSDLFESTLRVFLLGGNYLFRHKLGGVNLQEGKKIFVSLFFKIDYF